MYYSRHPVSPTFFIHVSGCLEPAFKQNTNDDEPIWLHKLLFFIPILYLLYHDSTIWAKESKTEYYFWQISHQNKAWINKANCLENFLACRKQRVTIGEASSKWSDVLSGVPQGSILWPLLFYIDDLPDKIENVTKLFADDSKIITVIGENWR